ncbi:MAG: tetratricopeptide repeat protein [Flavobacteriales bacterium]|nr:tetratricopeptide repeat protein [Flavobacteriales bacterium]
MSIFSSKQFWSILCLLVTFIVISPNLNNGWVNWDDENFVLKNQLVDDLSADHVHDIFTTPESNGGYTPMVLFSWSLDHSIDGYNPVIFHGTNNLLHLVNVWLVFTLIFLLTGKLNVTVVVTLLFGLHPTAVEAVGWITSRKDLLYGLFYLAGLVVYLKHLNRENRSQKTLYLICLVLFLGSLCSKGMAVTFPVTLLIIDYIKRRGNLIKLVIEKIPFFILSLVFGLIAIAGQQKAGTVGEIQNISFLESFFVGCYGLVLYLVKAIVPFQLSGYHPYPYELGESLPWFIYASIIPVILILITFIIVIRKNRTAGFGILFFLCSIVLMLQILPVGLAIISERFTYVAYIGLFFLVGIGVSKLTDKYVKKSSLIYAATGLFIAVLGIITYNRSDVWENGKSLWTDVINKYPEDYFGYCNRAEYYTSVGNVKAALRDYNTGVSLNEHTFKGLNNMGLIRMQLGQLDSAFSDFNRAISIKKDFPNPIINQGLILMNLNRNEEAMQKFNLASKVDTTNPVLYFNRGLLHNRNQNIDRAILDINKAIQLDPLRFEFYLARAGIQLRLSDPAAAKHDFLKVIELDPDNIQANFELGHLFLTETNLNDALTYFKKVVVLDPQSFEAYTNIGLIYVNLQQYQLALENLNQSISINNGDSNNLLNRGLAYLFLSIPEKATADFTACLLTQPNYAPAYYWRSVSHNKLNRKEEALSDALMAKSLNYAVDDTYIETLKQ